MLTLIVDTRERMDLKKLEEDLKPIVKVAFKVTERQLELGDFIIVDSNDQTRVIVERKAFSDFVSSLRPGHFGSMRLKDQTQRLASATTVPHRVLLLEGAIHDLKDEPMEKTVDTITVDLMIKGIHVIHVRNKEKTVYFLRNLLNKTELSERTGTGFEELMVTVRKRQTDTPEKLYQSFLQLLPGASINSARAICQEYPTMRTLREACHTNGHGAITKIKYNKRALSVKIAAGLCDFLAQA